MPRKTAHDSLPSRTRGDFEIATHGYQDKLGLPHGLLHVKQRSSTRFDTPYDHTMPWNRMESPQPPLSPQLPLTVYQVFKAIVLMPWSSLLPAPNKGGHPPRGAFQCKCSTPEWRMST